MKDRIDQLAKGMFEYEKPALVLSESQIYIDVAAGEVYEGSFTISNSVQRQMKGLLVTNCPFLHIKEDTFYTENVTIVYSFDASQLPAGESVKTDIHIISDCGECSIPFVANIEVPSCNTAAGKIKDLFHFANYAKEDTENAIKLFRSPFFENTFLYRDSKNISLYRGLKKSMSGSLAMEEFLVAVHKKLPIHIKADKTAFVYQNCKENFMDTVAITKDNWGFMELHISSNHPCVIPENKIIWTDQFMGNLYELNFVLDCSKMMKGRNFATITVQTPAQVLEITVEAELAEHDVAQVQNKIAVQVHLVRLTQLYLDFRMGRIAHDTYVDEMESLLYKLDGIISHHKIELCRLHMSIIDNRESAVREYLDGIAKKMERYEKEEPLLYAAALYLKALYTKEEADIKDAVQKIRYLYEHGNRDWQMLWFLLYLDGETVKPQRRLAQIYEQIENGCHSPILYYEAFLLYNEDDMLLQELQEQSILVMNWVIKQGLADREQAVRYAYLAGRLRSFSPLVYLGLTQLYEQFEDDEILSAICSMLIRGHRNHSRYHGWFALGVEKNLRIVELYEYYMYTFSRSTQEDIPHKVRMYFVHDNHLPAGKKALLFAWLIAHKEELADTYHEYYRSMQQFMMEQLEEGNVSYDLAILYEDMISREMIDKKIATLLPKVMFCYEISCSNPNVVGVCVIHRECKGEVYTPLENGHAIIEMVTENAEVFLCDRQENRYIETIPYTLSKLVHLDEYVAACYDYNRDDKRLLLYLYQRIEQMHKSGNDTVMIRKRVLELPDLSSHDQKKCFATMVQYYFDNFEGERLEQLLLQIQWDNINYVERTKMIEYCIIRNLYEKAFEGVKMFGYEGVSRKRLLQMASMMITTKGLEEANEDLLKLCYYVFTAGKFDEKILEYLLLHYNGTARELFSLWRVADGFELRGKDLEERLLAQMLFADSYITGSHKVFVSYYQGGQNKKLVRAYLAYAAHRYLIKDIQVHEDVFAIMHRECLMDKNKVCILALLKHYGECGELGEDEKEFCDYYVRQMADEKLVFSFFKNLDGKIELPYMLRDKFIVEYICNPAHPVTIHYRIEKKGESEEFVQEAMENRFEGIHVREFVLFHGEILQYYITEQTEEGPQITESISTGIEEGITHEGTKNGENRFKILNTMTIARQMRDEKTLIDMMEEYAKDVGLRRMAFAPLEADEDNKEGEAGNE